MAGMETSTGDKMIPVFVNVFNRLTTTQRLCEQLAAMPEVAVIIVDNNSTYFPLLEWYNRYCPHHVVRLDENMGHHAPWHSGIVEQYKRHEFYCVTDCDLDLDGVPADLMAILQHPFTSWSSPPVKSGVALRIDDLPPSQTQVREWEQRFWRHRVDAIRYWAPIDTTLAMYRAHTPVRVATKVAGVRSVRTAGPYTARHMPWYLDLKNLDDENANYFATANDSNSWRPDGDKLTSRFCGGPRHAPRRV